MEQVAWIALSCVAIGIGIAAPNRVALGAGIMMYLLVFGLLMIQILNRNQPKGR